MLLLYRNVSTNYRKETIIFIPNVHRYLAYSLAIHQRVALIDKSINRSVSLVQIIKYRSPYRAVCYNKEQYPLVGAVYLLLFVIKKDTDHSLSPGTK